MSTSTSLPACSLPAKDCCPIAIFRFCTRRICRWFTACFSVTANICCWRRACSRPSAARSSWVSFSWRHSAAFAALRASWPPGTGVGDDRSAAGKPGFCFHDWTHFESGPFDPSRAARDPELPGCQPDDAWRAVVPFRPAACAGDRHQGHLRALVRAFYCFALFLFARRRPREFACAAWRSSARA